MTVDARWIKNRYISGFTLARNRYQAARDKNVGKPHHALAQEEPPIKVFFIAYQ